jgi:hypothetical protein
VRSWGPWPRGCTRSRPTVAVSESYWGGEAEVKRQRPGGRQRNRDRWNKSVMTGAWDKALQQAPEHALHSYFLRDVVL